jgi:hypothetical protein
MSGAQFIRRVATPADKKEKNHLLEMVFRLADWISADTTSTWNINDEWGAVHTVGGDTRRYENNCPGLVWPLGFWPWPKGCRMRRAATQEPAPVPPLAQRGRYPAAAGTIADACTVAHSPSLAFLLGMQGTGWGWAAFKHYATLFVTHFFIA